MPPPDDASPLDHLLFRQHDVVSYRQAVRHLSRATLRHRVDSGRWQRPLRSVYVARPGDLSLPQQRWVAVLATGGVLAGFSALEALGLQGYRKPFTQILITAERRIRAPSNVQVRRTRRLHDVDVLANRAPPATAAARSIIDAAQWAHSDDEAVAVVAAGFQQRLVGGDDVRQALRRAAPMRRGTLIAEVAAAAAGGSASISEVEFLRLCRRNGLPEPSRQVVRLDARGRKRYRDALFEEYQVHVEIDGSQHMESRAWNADMLQHNEIAIAGGRLLRFAAWQVRHRPGDVIAQLRAALVAGGWRP
ncbi:hypothetical protein Drose_27395 [Dactylosporangium roseum]|uniref:DUF559 domain-containing protein n=1 Tax=Dactylosporangium roseum TaxID=47989 RepID=A0ABY5ZEN7_9ACTN|nr:hypothetical protein Drose_27395 [Dactylosporangium roseum]